MGLIRAALGAAGGVMADQWKEYFYCEAIPENVMAVKGQHRVSGRSSPASSSVRRLPSGPQGTRSKAMPRAASWVRGRMTALCSMADTST